MALDVQYSGNIVNQNGTAIDCNYKLWVVGQDVWSNIRDSSADNQKYNINLGDGDILTQSGSVANGETIIIVFETTEASVFDRKFAMYETTYDGGSTYIQDVQLKPVQLPNVNGLWYLNSPTDGNTTFNNAADGDVPTYIGRINEAISAVTNFNDEQSWDYSGATMKQVLSAYGTDIFNDRLGIASIEFDWDESDTFVTDTSHTFTVISQTDADQAQEVEVKVTNEAGLVVNNVLKLQVRYNSPVPDVTWDPTNPSVQDTFTVTGAVTDVDGRVTAISWKFDGTEVANNTTLDYSWTQDLGSTYQPTHTVNADTSWNDGFNDFTIVHQETVEMTNLAPSFTLTEEVIGDPEANDIKFTPTGLTDPDGDDAQLELKWKIEYKTPFDNTYKVVYNPGYPATADLDPKEWIFGEGGDYRITATAKDQYGLEFSQFIEKSFASGADCTGAGQIKLNNDVWQLIAVPVENKNVKEYFFDRIDAIVKIYDSAKGVEDIIERANCYLGNENKFRTFIPGFTGTTDEGNFPLVYSDGTNIKEISGFWVKMLDYKTVLNTTDDIIYTWDQTDA